MEKLKTSEKWRYISILGILIIVLPGILLTAYAGKSGVYIGSAIFIIIGGAAIYEVISALGFNKITAVLCGLIIIPFFLLGFDDFKRIGTPQKEDISIKLYIKWALTWKPYLIILIASLIPTFTEPSVSKGKMNIFTIQLIITFVMIVTSTFTKGLWAMNAYKVSPVFYFLLIAILSDTFGYFGGKYFGIKLFKGKKLAPKLSPKKTWAGAVIGFIFAFIFSLFFGYYLHIWESVVSINEWVMSFLAAMILSIISPIGDLIFSGIKRKLGIKDFSNLLPGHGGIFDRVDAMSIVIFVGLMTYLIIK